MTMMFLGLAVVFSTLSIHVRLPATYIAEQVLLWLGVVTWSAFFLLLACTMALARAPGNAMGHVQADIEPCADLAKQPGASVQ